MILLGAGVDGNLGISFGCLGIVGVLLWIITRTDVVWDADPFPTLCAYLGNEWCTRIEDNMCTTLDDENGDR